MKKVKFKRNVFNQKKLKTWARKIKIRDNFKCIACGYKGALHSHHILKKSKHRKYVYDMRNGVTLCVVCHMSSNGVHGSGPARNETVKKLRSLMNSGKFSEVCLFLESKRIACKNTVIKSFKKKKKYVPYKKFKRRLYQSKIK